MINAKLGFNHPEDEISRELAQSVARTNPIASGVAAIMANKPGLKNVPGVLTKAQKPR